MEAVTTLGKIMVKVDKDEASVTLATTPGSQGRGHDPFVKRLAVETAAQLENNFKLNSTLSFQ